MKPELQETITNLGLEYRLMTQFTSFVAVEEMIVTDGGQPRRIDVPVEVPEGVNREAVSADGLSVAPTGSLRAYQTVNLPSVMLNSGTAQPAARSQSVAKSGTNAKAKAAGAGGGGRGAARGSNGAAAKASPAASLSSFVLMDAEEPARIISPEEQHLAQLRTRLHPSILAVVDRLKNKNPIPGADETKFIHEGKAEVQIWLTDKSEETLEKLKELGFEVVLDPKSAKLIIGRLPIEKLEALAELKAIRYVAPQVSNN
jgi:Ca-activated chloride channel family protein